MRAEDEIILQVDMRNAFDSLDRQEMLNEGHRGYIRMRLRAPKHLPSSLEMVSKSTRSKGFSRGMFVGRYCFLSLCFVWYFD